jgi:hypothetical protein
MLRARRFEYKYFFARIDVKIQVVEHIWQIGL